MPGAELVSSIGNHEAIGLGMDSISLRSEPLHEEGPQEQLDSPSSQDTDLKGLPEKHVAALPSLEGQDILRATSITNVLRRGGRILQNSAGSAETYLLSKPRQCIDLFISHNWAVPRWKKFWALALYTNVAQAVAVSYCCAAVGALLDMLSVPPLLQAAGYFVRPHCLILGTCGFWVMLTIGHDLPCAGRLCCRQQVFLDKICIHQTDPALKAAGINSLGAFLRYSKKMLVLFNVIYCRRLWTVYEIACYMYLHCRSRLDLLPVDLVPVVLNATVLITAVHGVTMWIVYFGSDPALVLAYSSSVLAGVLCALSWMVRSWVLQRSFLYSDLLSFEIAQAECADESDRVVVSRNICSFVRSMGLVSDGASDAEALASFDKFVQERMPEMLRSAVGHTGVPYKYIFITGIAFDFYALDEVSSDPYATLLVTLARLVHHLVIRICLFPLTVYMCALVSNRCRPRTGWAEVAVKCGICITTLLVVGVFMGTAATLRELASFSVSWLIAYATLTVPVMLVVLWLFS